MSQVTSTVPPLFVELAVGSDEAQGNENGDGRRTSSSDLLHIFIPQLNPARLTTEVRIERQDAETQRKR